MTNNYRPCGINTCFLGIALGVILSVLIGALQFLYVLPFIQIGIAIAAVLAFLALGLLYAGAYTSEVNPAVSLDKCLKRHTACLLVGIFGTILSAAVALSVALAPFSIISAIIVGVVTFFLTILIVELIAFLVCFVFRSPRCQE